MLFTSKIRDREEGIVIYSFYMYGFCPLPGSELACFLKLCQERRQQFTFFQSGVRNWPAGMSWQEIEVFNLQA